MMAKSTELPVQTTIAGRGRLLDLSRPQVMAIVNLSSDSFHTHSDAALAADTAGAMLEQGAAVLDLGGVSTRPGAPDVSAQEEADRLLPALEAVCGTFPDAWVSVDTQRSEIARLAVGLGARIVNDVSGGTADDRMLATMAETGAAYVAMHRQGTPQHMQDDPQYADVTREVFDFLKGVRERCIAAGVRELILDPGFGFGKTVRHNFTLLAQLRVFRLLGYPVLAGISRKSMVCRPLRCNPSRALNGTTALHMVALQQGASLLRAHDVREAREVITLWEELEACDR